MKLLIGWDKPQEAELIQLYLTASGNEVELALNPDDFEQRAVKGRHFDAVLMPTDFPDSERGFVIFHAIQQAQPDCPVIGACHSEDLFRIARFLLHGMRSYVLRDRSQDFVFLLQTTVESVIRAVQAERERRITERLREEIDSVRKLQESIIPRDPQAPRGYSICARYEPAQIRVLGGQPVVMAGGDYYDVFSMSEHSAVLLVGDASGHGMKACMSIMTMHTLVRMIRGSNYRATSAFVAEVNRMLCDQSIVTGDGGFITLLYAVLAADRHEIEWTSAGHPVPLLHNLETNDVTPLAGDDAGGVPLGIIADESYAHCTSPVPPRSRVLFYTDGLVEAFADDEGEHREFGCAGVIETLRKCRHETAAATMGALFDASSQFTAGSGRHDDTSVLLIERA